jgi:hypothetical protein
VTTCDFFTLKTDVNISSKSNKQKKSEKKYFLSGILKFPDPNQDASGTDPRIRVRTKMSRTHDAARRYDQEIALEGVFTTGPK